MPRTYKGYYKCRLCGEVFCDGCTTGNRNLAVDIVVEKGLGRDDIVKNPQKPNITTIHFCSDEGLGLADFIGWKLCKEE